MFKEWLETHDIEAFDLSSPLFPKAKERAFWDSRSDPALIKSGESCLGYEYPMLRATQFMKYPADGDRLAYENPHFARRRVLIALALAELCEYRGRFIPDLVDGLLAVCEETFWGISAHVPKSPFPQPDNEYFDLFAAETAEILSVILYLFEDELTSFCPPIVERMRYELKRRIAEPYLRHFEYAWMGRGYPVNNWTTWIESNVLTVFLLTEPRDEKFYAAMRKMFEEIDFWYTSRKDDGGCDEGANYFTLAGGKFFEFCDQLYVASGGALDFFADEKVKNIGLYEYHAYIGGGWFVNFGDGAPRLTANLDWLAYGFGLRVKSPELMALGREMSKYKHPPIDAKEPFDAALTRENKIKRDIYSLIYKDDIAAAPQIELEKRCVLPDLQMAVMREGKWFVGAKGGHNGESHSHNDVGSFVAYYDSSPVLVDPSNAAYTKKTFSPERYSIWTHSSAWHNVPTLRGFVQHESAEYRASAFSLDENTVAVSFPLAYAAEAGIVRLDRRITLGVDGVAVDDDIALREAGTIEVHFVTPLDVRLEDGRAILGDRFELFCDGAAQIAAETVGFDGDAKLIEYWGTDRMNRVTFSLSAKEATLRSSLRAL